MFNLIVYLDFIKHSANKKTQTDLAPEASICQLRNALTFGKVLFHI